MIINRKNSINNDGNLIPNKETNSHFKTNETVSKSNLSSDSLKTVKKTNSSSVFSKPKAQSFNIDESVRWSNNKLNSNLISYIQKSFEQPETGKADQMFVHKVVEFQRKNNLTADGKIGNKTLSVMQKTGLIKNEDNTPKYDELFKDGVLDITVGLGFDENEIGNRGLEFRYNELKKNLDSRGFKEVNSKDKLSEIFNKLGQELPEDNSYVTYFYNENSIKNNDKEVSYLVRVIKPDQNDGTKPKQAFLLGMNNSDISIYDGHGRYGTGLDFDKNFDLTLKLADGSTHTFVDYSQLENLLEKKDEKTLKIIFGDDPQKIEKVKNTKPEVLIKQMIEDGLVETKSINNGNIIFNKNSPRKYEFGGYLLDKALNNDTHKITYSSEIKSSDAPKYRIWSFMGCRTNDYMNGIKKDKTLSNDLKQNNLDIIATSKVIYTSEAVGNIVAHIDSFTNKESKQQIKNRIEQVSLERQKDVVVMNGFNHSPILDRRSK
ncbi:MAG: peptidoglycan-binding domain-containing protein [Candidatus Sericytochromatia bacterium]